MPGEVSAGAKHRQLAGQIRQVSNLCGPGFVITILKGGMVMLDVTPAPKYVDEDKRFYTVDWFRPKKSQLDVDLRST